MGAKYCAVCGAQVENGFGSAGASVPRPSSGMGMRTERLVRPRYPRMIAGVCSAFALQYGWDLSLVRVVAALIAVFSSGIGVFAYIAAWVIIPDAPYQLPGTAGSTTGNPTV